MDRPLPPDMAKLWGNLRFIRYKGSGEWGSECPKCKDSGHNYNISGDDPDRWMMWEASARNNRSGKIKGKCRKCQHLEWEDSNDPTPVSPQQQQANLKQQIDQIKKQEAEYKAKLDWLRAQRFWLEAHYNMTAGQKKLWTNAGIDDYFIDLHKLGYLKDKHGGCMSIPYFKGGDTEDDLCSLQYRLEHPDNPNDKYKWEKGLRAEIFRVWPQDPINTGVTLLCEGVKKSIVVFQKAENLTYLEEEVTVIAVPSKTVPQRLIEQLVGVEVLIWMLDPDAYEATKVNGKTIPAVIDRNIALAVAAGITDNRIVRTVDKIDDMFNYKRPLSGRAFSAMVKQAELYTPNKKGTPNGHSNKRRVRTRHVR
jgi:hypothetical protein